MSKKSALGQFNTTKKEYILKGMENFVQNKDWIDPYAGNCDLLEWVNLHGSKSISGYDVDESKVSLLVKHRDTLLNPPDYKGSYIIANPPYLAKNKSKDKTLYEKYNQDDLYKVSILTTSGCEGGIFIVPLNFLSSLYANSIRDIFFKNYKIKFCKIFEESVFEDTDYTVCAFVFEKRKSEVNEDEIKIKFLPSQKELTFRISSKYHWILGEEFYKHIDGINHFGVSRWTEKDMKGASYKNQDMKKEKEDKDSLIRNRGTVFVNDFNRPEADYYFYEKVLEDIILIRAIDTGTTNGRIGLVDIRQVIPSSHPNAYPVLLGLETSRNKAHVKFGDKFIGRPSIEEQLKIIDIVNKRLEKFREKYNSVFLTAYRNSTEEYSRKRISFDVLYDMMVVALKEIRNK